MADTGSVSCIQRRRTGKLHRLFTQCFLFGILFDGMAQADDFPLRIDGDIGVGGYYTRSIIRDKPDLVSVLPYGYFDYGRMFLRIDTFGIKTMKVGYGYLEIAGRIRQDGFTADVPALQGLNNRQASVPLGLGTMQVTPIGAVFINAFHDINKSKGNLFEAIYVGKLDTPQLTFYPLAGGEYQSGGLVRYYYGISTQEAASSGYAIYQPSGAFNPLLGLMVDAGLGGDYHLDLYLRRKWLGDAIRSSPIVDKGIMDTGFIALSYRFK